MNSGETFFDASALSGFDLDDDGRGLAQVDWDHDGDLDCWISNRTGPQIRFLENQYEGANNFIVFRLQGTDSNRDAIGSRIKLYLAGDSKPLTRNLSAGNGFLSQSSKEVHFGLGSNPSVERVELTWPSGKQQTFSINETNCRYKIVEGSDSALRLDVAKNQIPNRVPPSTVATNDASSPRSTLCFSMIAFPADTYKTEAGTEQSIVASSRLVLVNLWLDSCQACVDELEEFSRGATRLRERGIDVVALSLDRLSSLNSADAGLRSGQNLLREMQFPFRSGVADQQLVTKLQLFNDTLFDLNDPLPIPTSFLLDRKRRVVAVYKGPVSVDKLLTDANKLKVKTTEEWRMATMDFPGRWIMSPKRRHLYEYVERLIESGFIKESREYVQRDPEMFVKHPRWNQMRRKLQESQ